IENDALMLGCLNKGAADQTKSFSEARLAGAAVLNSGSDLIATEVIDNIEEIKAAKGWEAFAAMSAAHSRYETGSHITLNSYNIAAGVSKKISNAVTLGIFAEVGNGSYSTVNEFKDGNVNADGDIDYYGGGLLVKAEGKKTTIGQLYAEASVRAGHIKSDYNSDTFELGTHTNFDTSGSYIGAHAGIGYKWSMKDGADIDTYIKYLWNKQNGDSPMVDGQRFDLNDINSHRLRVGLRYNSRPNNDALKFFAGLAYEHEFDGTAKGTMGEYALLEPDFTGGSARAELGIKYDKKESPWKVELGLTGYAGKRESIGATLNAWYEFGGEKQKAETEATEVTETTATETTETTATETTKAE
ncbi:MAG: autotransporter outer membrane beta-barrel domain-containing protein, partial [Synergistes sp.]|nr:autotransporter outer membrane beta-barrel domain-containing protein [Synergistes sp.]